MLKQHKGIKENSNPGNILKTEEFIQESGKPKIKNVGIKTKIERNIT